MMSSDAANAVSSSVHPPPSAVADNNNNNNNTGMRDDNKEEVMVVTSHSQQTTATPTPTNLVAADCCGEAVAGASMVLGGNHRERLQAQLDQWKKQIVVKLPSQNVGKSQKQQKDQSAVANNMASTQSSKDDDSSENNGSKATTATTRSSQTTNNSLNSNNSKKGTTTDDEQQEQNRSLTPQTTTIPSCSSSSDGGSGGGFGTFPRSSDDKNKTLFSSCSEKWTNTIKRVHTPMLHFLLILSKFSARNPKRTLTGIILFSYFMLVIGFVTNFQLDVDEKRLWTPNKSISKMRGQTLPKIKAEKPKKETEPPTTTEITNTYNVTSSGGGFGGSTGGIALVFHNEGKNVLGHHQITHIFDAIDRIRNHELYGTVCAHPDFDNAHTSSSKKKCEITGIVRFWNFSTSVFHETTTALYNETMSEKETIRILSQDTYPDDIPVATPYVMGYAVRDNTTNLLTSVQSYMITIVLPSSLTDTAVEMLQHLDAEWANDKSIQLRIEVQGDASFAEEFTRGITRDIPLVIVVFFTMSGFTSLVFSKRNVIQSRSLLGVAAVVSILLSVMTGYGLLFMIGVPFTSMTPLMPFILFGVGLDDAFIIVGSYLRTNPNLDIIDRIDATIRDIGMSIVLTTLTSATAFSLGTSSSIPAVYWLCLYAFPTIIVVLFYQVTFFVACIALDERRVLDGRRDICIWKKARPQDAGQDEDHQVHVADRIMGWYAEKLLKPCVKVIVLVFFTVLAGMSGWSASQLTQEFKFTDVLPSDSYITKFIAATTEYSDLGAVRVTVYFRDVDQSDKEIQRQMREYIDDIVTTLPDVNGPPEYFWLDHFELFLNITAPSGMLNRPFSEQMDEFLNIPAAYEAYGGMIQRDEEGGVIHSKTHITVAVDLDDVNAQIDWLRGQRDVSRSQPINQEAEDIKDWPFFMYDSLFNMWEFYTVSVGELKLTTIMGITAMTGIALLFIPHWTGAFFIFPVICVLYVDLMGFMQWGGLHINAVTYVSLTMSIGLLVDFIMHVLFRYYECSGNRHEKTVEMLRTMGASILLGGTTTFLGTVPIAFSTSKIFHSVFITFLGMVLLGLSHGLILLPVLLSTFGPEDQVTMSHDHEGRVAKPEGDGTSKAKADDRFEC